MLKKLLFSQQTEYYTRRILKRTVRARGCCKASLVIYVDSNTVNPWWGLNNWSECRLPAGMKWRLAASPPDPRIIMQKPHQFRSFGEKRQHLNATRAATLPIIFVKNSVIFFICMCVMKRDWMYNTGCTQSPSSTAPQSTSGRVSPHQAEGCW